MFKTFSCEILGLSKQVTVDVKKTCNNNNNIFYLHLQVTIIKIQISYYILQLGGWTPENNYIELIWPGAYY